MNQREKAELFRRMHQEPPILVLANAWDVVSAKLVESLPGCRAIATSSAAVAWALGCADGEVIPPEEMLEAVRRIAAAVQLPVTADLEAGYGDARATAEAAIEAGAVGLNLEDGVGETSLVSTDEHVKRIEAIRKLDFPLVINARTDVFLSGLDDFDEAVGRANAYLDAGADCAFVPGVTDELTIARLVRAIDGPVSILGMAATPPSGELERLGVARVSVGSGLARLALARTRETAAAVLTEGNFAVLAEAVPGAELNDLLG